MIVTSGCDRRVHRCAPPTSKPAESLVSQSDSAEIRALLNLTDPVERHRANETGTRVWDVSDDYVGAYPEYILPPFLHPNPSRFSDGTFGVLYAGLDFDTAVRESAHWLAVVYAHANAPAGLRPRKVYLTFRIVATLVDARKASGSQIPNAIYNADDYTASRRFGKDIYDGQHEGIWYDSVRSSRGECIAAFVPRILSQPKIQHEIEFEWDGRRFANIKRISNL